MKIALFGYGKMGKEVEKIALSRGHTLACAIEKNDSKPPSFSEIDFCIDFSAPEAVLGNVEIAASEKTSLVIGTTGWEHQMPQVKDVVQKSGIGCVYAPNFSIGVNLFFDIVKHAARLINSFDQYDVSGFEMHHSQKVDSPSGTAKEIASFLLEELDRKKRTVFDLGNRKLSDEELHFSSIRCGNVPGTHTVIFDSEEDSISISHQARNRKGFALGSVIAGEKLQGKKGFFTFEELLRFVE